MKSTFSLQSSNFSLPLPLPLTYMIVLSFLLCFSRSIIKVILSQKGKPIPSCPPYIHIWMWKSINPFGLGQLWGLVRLSGRPRASSPSWRKLLLGTYASAPSFPALAPLNLHPQWIIKPALDGLTEHERPSVFLLKGLKYLKRHGSKTWNMIIWQQACS